MKTSQRYDHLLLAALAGGKSIRAAARVARCSESYARRKVKDPAFQRMLDDARKSLLQLSLAAIAERLADRIETAPHPTVEDTTAGSELIKVLWQLVNMAGALDAPVDPHFSPKGLD